MGSEVMDFLNNILKIPNINDNNDTNINFDYIMKYTKTKNLISEENGNNNNNINDNNINDNAIESVLKNVDNNLNNNNTLILTRDLNLVKMGKVNNCFTCYLNDNIYEYDYGNSYSLNNDKVRFFFF